MQEVFEKIISLPNSNIFDMISICISLINIITTLVLAGVNLYFIQRNRKRDNYYKAFLEYYFPIRYKLISLSKDINMFNNTYGIKNTNFYELDVEKKHLLVTNYLVPYLDFYGSLPKYCLFTNIDLEIIQLNQYYENIIYIVGIEGTVNVDELQEKYPHINIDKLINNIDKVIKKYL